MHHSTKKASVAKYGPLFQDNGYTQDQLREAIQKDDKKFSAEDVEIIFNAIVNPAAPAPPEEEDEEEETTEEQTASDSDDGYDQNKPYQEYRVEWPDHVTGNKRNHKTAQKSKFLRNTLITEAEADLMNSMCNQHNPIAFYPAKA